MTNFRQRLSRKTGKTKQPHRSDKGCKQKFITECNKLDPVEERNLAEQDFEAMLADWPVY